MFKISNIISKPVYTLYEGILVGTIINFAYDKNRKKIKGFFIFDDESESEHYIESKNIYKIGVENILVRNRSKIQPYKFEKKSILNMQVVSIDGDWSGIIRDVFFDEKFKVISVKTKDKIVIPINKIVHIGQDILIFNNNKKVFISRMKPASKILVENLPNIKVNILEESELATTPILSKTPVFLTTPKIDKVIENSSLNNDTKNLKTDNEKKDLFTNTISNPKSIIGKHSRELIIGLNGEVVVKKGQLITEKIYEKAKQHLKLFELTNNIFY